MRTANSVDVTFGIFERNSCLLNKNGSDQSFLIRLTILSRSVCQLCLLGRQPKHPTFVMYKVLDEIHAARFSAQTEILVCLDAGIESDGARPGEQ